MVMLDDPGAGFENPPLDGQCNFRALLEATSRPGTVHTLTRLPDESDAQMGLALTLFDHETAIWLDAGAQSLRQRLVFHCGCPLVKEPGRATFALLTDPAGLMDWSLFSQGVPEFPDRSTTVICEVPALEGGNRLVLRGPGIEGVTEFSPQGMPEGFVQSWAMNAAQYPLGIDLILTSKASLAALPRTCQVEG